MSCLERECWILCLVVGGESSLNTSVVISSIC
jgi:hypothetical protein